MSSCNTLIRLIDEGTVSQQLQRKSEPDEKVEDLQLILYEMGFGPQLQWELYGADGYYGDATARAVARFASLNGLDGNGDAVTPEIAHLMVKRYDELDEMHEIYLHRDEMEEKCFVGSPHKVEVAAAQTLLNTLGYGDALKWEQYRNDGDYGSATRMAVKLFYVDQGLSGNGEALTSEGATRMIEILGRFYGSDWTKHIRTIASSEQEIVHFSGSHFQGKKVVADRLFIPFLERINDYAAQHQVKVHVTSSLRTSTNVTGAIVRPASRSNHLVGHAIDMNVTFPGGFANSGYLRKSKEEEWDAHVKGFINAIRDDHDLRWGGDFTNEDPVHIDDGLNVNDPELWSQRFTVVQEAYKSNGGTS